MVTDLILIAADTASGRVTKYKRARCAAEGCHRRLSGRRMEPVTSDPKYCSHLCGVNSQPDHVLVKQGGNRV